MKAVFVISSGKTQAKAGPMSLEKRDIGDVVLTERSYSDDRMSASTITERPVAVVVPKNMPDNAIVIAFMPGYFFKHNTRVHCPHGREIARGFWSGPKQSHEHVIAWLLPGEWLTYTVGGRVGAEKHSAK